MSVVVLYVGKVCSNNQDFGYVGLYFFIVVDGMGGYVGGDVVLVIVVKWIVEVDVEYLMVCDVEIVLQELLILVNVILVEMVFEYSEFIGMGIIVSGIFCVGN